LKEKRERKEKEKREEKKIGIIPVVKGYKNHLIARKELTINVGIRP
jgi:hypothetical protein